LLLRSFSVILIILFSVFSAAISIDAGNPKPSEPSVTSFRNTPEIQVIPKDFRGRPLTGKLPAKRIVCLIESALSGLYMLDAENAVVGIGASVYQGETAAFYGVMDERIRKKEIPAPGNWDFVNVEGILTLRPDLVIIWAHQTEAITALEERGIPVCAIQLDSINSIYEEIRLLGEITGHQKRANELIDFTMNRLLDLHKRIAGPTGQTRPTDLPRVYFMWAQSPLDSAGGASIVNEMIDRAGGQNICGSIKQEHVVINLEQLLTWNPEVIIMWYDERKDPRDILQDPQMKSLAAVRSGRVHEFPRAFLCDLWTLKWAISVTKTAAWCYPSLFSEQELMAEQETFVQFFYRGRIPKGFNP
jgi:iron complex transport system substrate-binding protein